MGFQNEISGLREKRGRENVWKKSRTTAGGRAKAEEMALCAAVFPVFDCVPGGCCIFWVRSMFPMAVQASLGDQEPVTTTGVFEHHFNLSIETVPDRIPDDSKYDSWDVSKPGGNNWGLECIDAPGAWEYQDEMSTVKVGLIDSSLDFDHPDLQIDLSRASILATEDFATLEELENYYNRYADSHECIGNPDECVFCSQKDHGTHCAGIMAALANNGKGVSGVNWNAETYFATWWYYTIPQKGQLRMTDSVYGWVYDITRLAMSGCRVISISVGTSAVTDPETNASL